MLVGVRERRKKGEGMREKGYYWLGGIDIIK